MTVIAGSGYLVRVDTMRADYRTTTFVPASDILSMSGFPITAEQVASAGFACMFLKSRTAPPERTSRSMKKQVGNAMHFTHVGSVFLCALVKFPMLGAVPGPQAPKKRSEAPPALTD